MSRFETTPVNLLRPELEEFDNRQDPQIFEIGKNEGRFQIMSGMNYEQVKDELNRLDVSIFEATCDQERDMLQELLKKRALLLKMLWRTKDYSKISQIDQEAIPDFIENIDTSLEGCPVYCTDTVEGKDNRQLRDAEDLQQHSRYILEKLRWLDKSLPEQELDDEKDTKQFLQDCLDFCQDRKILTRPGLSGIIDIASDGFIVDKIIDKRISQRADLQLENLLPHLTPEKQAQAKDFLTQGKTEEAENFRFAELPEEIRFAYQEKINAASAEELKKILIIIDRINGVTENFGLENIETDSQQLPLEIEYLFAAAPEIKDDIENLIKRGAKLRLQTVENTPQSVLHSINNISVISQENYITTWLPDLVKNVAQPNIKPTKEGLRRAQSKDLISEGETPNLSQDVRNIADIAGEYKKIVVLNPEALTDDDMKVVDKANIFLEKVNQEYATRKMVFDNANERTHGAQEILKKMMLIGPLAHGLEMLDLGVVAKIFASSTDDLMGEVAEVKALLGSGFTLKELVPRLAILAPVFGAATVGAVQSEHLLDAGHEAGAGALFGITAVALSLTTALLSIKMYKQAYDNLLDQGKLQYIPELTNNPNFQKILKEFEATEHLLEDKIKLLELIKQTLDNLSEAVDENDKEKLLQRLEGLNFEEIKKLISSPSQFKRLLQAIKQDFSNPARLGIMIGSGMAPIVGAIAGQTGLMHNGFAMAAIGSTESIVAGGTVIAAEKINDLKYKKYLLHQIANARKANEPESALESNLESVTA